jgi:hypothetical protein
MSYGYVCKSVDESLEPHWRLHNGSREAFFWCLSATTPLFLLGAQLHSLRARA